jgi:hypothetical protein
MQPRVGFGLPWGTRKSRPYVRQRPVDAGMKVSNARNDAASDLGGMLWNNMTRTLTRSACIVGFSSSSSHRDQNRLCTMKRCSSAQQRVASDPGHLYLAVAGRGAGSNLTRPSHLTFPVIRAATRIRKSETETCETGSVGAFPLFDRHANLSESGEATRPMALP